MKFELLEPDEAARIKVIGVGGGGGNAVNNMVESGLQGVHFITANTDLQALNNSKASAKIQLGASLTKGLGAGANPEVGRNAALEDSHKLREALKDADMIFITAGLGGGTGTGASPVVAEIARDLGALTVAVVTKPFSFEGKARKKQAEEGIKALKEVVDTLITIPNDRLFAIAAKDAPFLSMLKKADEVLLYAVKGISDLIMVPGLINLDFADVRTIMSEMGIALMGTGVASGENRAITAAQTAIASPLLDDISIDGARGVLVNITASNDLTMEEVKVASSFIQESAHEDANIIWGAVLDDRVGEELRITVIATGIKDQVSVGEHPNLRPVSPPPGVLTRSYLKELDKPTYTRKKQKAALPGGYISPYMDTENDFSFDEINEGALDKPTFLRKQAD
jgi:cell division protein FtsZ